MESGPSWGDGYWDDRGWATSLTPAGAGPAHLVPHLSQPSRPASLPPQGPHPDLPGRHSPSAAPRPPGDLGKDKGLFPNSG